MISVHSSGSSCSLAAVEPTTSAKQEGDHAPLALHNLAMAGRFQLVSQFVGDEAIKQGRLRAGLPCARSVHNRWDLALCQSVPAVEAEAGLQGVLCRTVRVDPDQFVSAS
jgi:hypothetical protein